MFSRLSLHHLSILWLFKICFATDPFISSVYAQRLRSQNVPIWNGQPFTNEEGGVLFQIQLGKDFQSDSIQEAMIVFYQPAYAMHYLINSQIQSDGRTAAQVWRLPAGKFKLLEIELRKNDQTLRRWVNQDRRDFKVNPKTVNHFGQWYMTSMRKQKIDVIFRFPKHEQVGSDQATTRSINESGQKILQPDQKSRVETSSNPVGSTELSNGTKKNLPTRRRNLGVSSLPKSERPILEMRAHPLPSNTENREEDIRVFQRFKRQISLMYGANLFSQNHLNRNFIASITQRDSDLRRCYLERLEANDRLAGRVTFKFLYSGDEQLIRTLKPVKDTTADPQLIECIKWKVLSIDFSITDSFIGELIFDFQTIN